MGLSPRPILMGSPYSLAATVLSRSTCDYTEVSLSCAGGHRRGSSLSSPSQSKCFSLNPVVSSRILCLASLSAPAQTYQKTLIQFSELFALHSLLELNRGFERKLLKKILEALFEGLCVEWVFLKNVVFSRVSGFLWINDCSRLPFGERRRRAIFRARCLRRVLTYWRVRRRGSRGAWQ